MNEKTMTQEPSIGMEDEIERSIYLQDISKEISDNTVYGTLSFAEGFRLGNNDRPQEIRALQEYYESDLDSPIDQDIKKVVATGVVIAREKGLLKGKPWEGRSVKEIAHVVDDSMTKAKVAYKVGNGSMEPIDALEYLIDRYVVRLSTIVKENAENVGGNIGAKIGAEIGSIFGPVGTAAGAFVGRAVGRLAGKVVGGIIVKGIERVGTVVKSMARKAWDVAVSIKDKVCDFFRW